MNTNPENKVEINSKPRNIITEYMANILTNFNILMQRAIKIMKLLNNAMEKIIRAIIGNLQKKKIYLT
jgi:hypothetical protein